MSVRHGCVIVLPFILINIMLVCFFDNWFAPPKVFSCFLNLYRVYDSILITTVNRAFVLLC